VLAPVQPPAARRTAVDWVVLVLRVIFVVATLAAMGFSLWTHPRTGTTAGLRADLLSGDARSVKVIVSSDDRTSHRPWVLPDHKPNLPYLQWVTADRRVHDLRLGPGGFSGITSVDKPIPHAEQIPAALRADIATWQAKYRERLQPRLGWSVDPLGLLTLVALIVLVAGPSTVRGTKWAWFWFAGLMPCGSGVLAFLACERPWSRKANELYAAQRAFGPAAGPYRRTGLAGLGWGVLGIIVANAAVALLFWS
jgi:hypothetical protein